MGVGALVANGFISGVVLAPILRFASLYAPGTTQIAALMTAVVFLTISAFVMFSKRTFSAPRGLMVGIFVSIIAAMVLNSFLNIGGLGILIACRHRHHGCLHSGLRDQRRAQQSSSG